MTTAPQPAQNAEEVSPPWGAFPAEQYLIRYWDYSSSHGPDAQRQSLIRSFLKLDAIPKPWDTTGRENSQWSAVERAPTSEEIRLILAPWRPLRLRDAALHIWRDRHDEAIWVRTHYDNNNEKFAQWREIDQDYDPDPNEGDDELWCVMDDETSFHFGDDWGRVFDILPELAGPVQGYSRTVLDNPRVQSLQQELRAAINSGSVEEEEGEAIEASDVGMALQVAAVNSFLIIADGKAWETDRLRLLYLDAHGNIVRHSTTMAEDVLYHRHGWHGSKFRDSGWWQNRVGEPRVSFQPGGIIGDSYKASGEMGRLLYCRT